MTEEIEFNDAGEQIDPVTKLPIVKVPDPADALDDPDFTDHAPDDSELMDGEEASGEPDLGNAAVEGDGR